MVGCDNNRTPVIFQVSDNLVFVGDSTTGPERLMPVIFNFFAEQDTPYMVAD